MDGANLPFIAFGDDRQLAVGDRVYVMGVPGRYVFVGVCDGDCEDLDLADGVRVLYKR